MSEAYDRQLVAEGSSPYERVAAGTVAIAFLVMFGAIFALFGRQPVDAAFAGQPLYRWFGLGLLALGVSTLGLGVISRLEYVETAPSRVGGLFTGLIFGSLWAVAAGFAAANTLGLGQGGWLFVAPLAGLTAVGFSIVTREDLSSTVPVGLLLVFAGVVVLAGLFGPTWTWSPPDISATFPAGIVVPSLSFLLVLLGGWTAGKAYAGFGTRGRQTGAYLLISLVVVAVLGVLVALIAYITSKGLGITVENLSLGSATGLLVAVTLLVALASREAWTVEFDLTSPIAFVGAVLRVSILTVLSLLALLFTGVLAAGQSVTAGGVTLTPSTRIGTGFAFLSVLLLFVLARRQYDGIDVLSERDTLPENLRSGLLIGWLVLAGVAGFGLITGVADEPIAFVGTTLVSAVAVVLAAYPLVLLGQRLAAGESIRSAAVAPVAELRLAVTAGLGYLVLALWITVTTGVVAVAGTQLGPLVGVVALATAAQLVALCFAIYAVVLAAEYVRGEPAGETRDDALAQAQLATVGLTGALTVLLAHTVLTMNELVFFDLVTITPFGALDWPFVMNVSSGLGIQPGVLPAIVGTVWLVAGAVLFAVPLALGAAVYLTEYAEESLLTRIVEIATNGLWSTPSIVFGLFVLAFIVPRFGNTPSLFAGQLALGFMLMPLVLITSREALKSVPDEYRDASAALGVSKWETIRSVVIPAAMPGVITGVILGVGRIAGETAPILLVTRGPNFPSQAPRILESFQVSTSLQPPFLHVTNPALIERASALPYQVYAVISAGVGEREAFGWGTALVLLAVVLSFYAIGIVSRRYFRRKLEQ